MRNMTPHPITFRVGDSDFTVAPDPAGPARVSTRAMPLDVTQSAAAATLAGMLPERPADGPAPLLVIDHAGERAFPVPVVGIEYGDILGLPAEDEPVLVSLIVLEAIRRQQPWRRRAYAPDTGPDSAIRDDAGQIVAVRRLVGLPDVRRTK